MALHNSQIPIIDSLINDVAKLSVLTNAAKISPYVRSTTIGPLSDNEPTNGAPELDAKEKQSYTGLLITVENDINVVKNRKSQNNENENPSKRTVTIVDSEAISYNMYVKNMEKQTKNHVKKEMEERKVRQMEAAKILNAKYMNSLKNANSIIITKSLKSEKIMNDAIKLEEQREIQFNEKLELQKRENSRRQREKNQELQKIQEIAKQNQQLTEQIKSLHTYFRKGLENFTKTYESLNSSMAEVFINYKKVFEIMTLEADKMFCGSNIASSVLNPAEILCKNLDVLLQDFKEKINIEEKEILALQALAEQEQKNIAAQNELHSNNAKDELDANQSNDIITNFISHESNEFYSKVQKSFAQFTGALGDFTKDNNLKQYRFKLKIAINTPINAIPVNNSQQLYEIYEKLTSLLSGNNVKISQGQVSSNEHPLARCFCTAFLAEKFVDQGEQIISAGKAFPIAAIIVAVWQNFPDFGNCFLHYLYEQCPLLIPFIKPRIQGQSNEDYYKSLGYRFVDGEVEKADIYQKRISGLTRLYAAVCISMPRRGVTAPNPHNLQYAWKWLTNILKLDPAIMPMCPILLEEFLSTAGHALWNNYRKQFMKIINIIRTQYLIKLGNNNGGGVTRLQIVLDNISAGKLDPPPGLIRW